MTEKELEILFRKKFDDRKVEFNPAAWEGAERLIIAGEKRRRRRAIAAWSSAASVMLVVGFSVWGSLNTPRYQPIDHQMIAWPSESVSDMSAIAVESNASSSAPVESQSGEVNVPENALAVEVNQTSSTLSTQAEVEADLLAVTESTQTAAAIGSPSVNLYTEEAREEAIWVEAQSLDFAVTEVRDPSLSDPSRAYTGNTPEEAAVIRRPRHRVQSYAVGLEAGLNASEVSNGTLGWKPGFYVGVPFEFAFAENAMLRSGLFYSQRSGNGMNEVEEYIDYNFGVSTVTRNYKNVVSGYMELPITFAYAIGKSELEVGGYVGMRVLELSSTETLEQASLQSANVENYLTRRSNPSSELMDYGLRVGYAYRVDERWRITAQGTYGLMDTYDSDLSGMNRHVQLRLGVRYMLGL